MVIFGSNMKHEGYGEETIDNSTVPHSAVVFDVCNRVSSNLRKTERMKMKVTLMKKILMKEIISMEVKK